MKEGPPGDVRIIADEKGAVGIEETVDIVPADVEALVLPQMATNFLNGAARIEANCLNE